MQFAYERYGHERKDQIRSDVDRAIRDNVCSYDTAGNTAYTTWSKERGRVPVDAERPALQEGEECLHKERESQDAHDAVNEDAP
jgi:hypothetical protein